VISGRRHARRRHGVEGGGKETGAPLSVAESSQRGGEKSHSLGRKGARKKGRNQARVSRNGNRNKHGMGRKACTGAWTVTELTDGVGILRVWLRRGTK